MKRTRSDLRPFPRAIAKSAFAAISGRCRAGILQVPDAQVAFRFTSKSATTLAFYVDVDVVVNLNDPLHLHRQPACKLTAVFDFL
jgi:hypothetical protein